MAATYQESACSCHACQRMCSKRACWPTPEEVEALIAAGHTKRLWIDYWQAGGRIFKIIGPAAAGWEGKKAPSRQVDGATVVDPTGSCTFYKDGLCALHDPGLKPFEGRMATHKPQPHLHHDTAMLWNTDKGRQVVQLWLMENCK